MHKRGAHHSYFVPMAASVPWCLRRRPGRNYSFCKPSRYSVAAFWTPEGHSMAVPPPVEIFAIAVAAGKQRALARH